MARVILVTGASSGFGRAILDRLYARGYKAYGTSRSGKFPSGGVPAAAPILPMDVRDEASVKAAVDFVAAHEGRLDAVINNAGAVLAGSVEDTSPAEALELFQTNFFGAHRVCRAVLPLMMEKKWGRIINISGVSPYLGGSAIKAMVKLGIVGFTRGIAREFAPHNITANCVGPGTIGRAEVAEHESVKEVRSSQPIQRKGRPEEVTSVLVHLASKDASFITGQCYLVNGGQYFQ